MMILALILTIRILATLCPVLHTFTPVPSTGPVRSQELTLYVYKPTSITSDFCGSPMAPLSDFLPHQAPKYALRTSTREARSPGLMMED